MGTSLHEKMRFVTVTTRWNEWHLRREELKMMGGGGSIDYGGGGKRKRANVVLKTLDFCKAQWERFATKNVFPNGMPAASWKERNL